MAPGIGAFEPILSRQVRLGLNILINFCGSLGNGSQSGMGDRRPKLLCSLVFDEGKINSTGWWFVILLPAGIEEWVGRADSHREVLVALSLQ